MQSMQWQYFLTRCRALVTTRLALATGRITCIKVGDGWGFMLGMPHLDIRVARLMEQSHQEGLDGFAAVYRAFGPHLKSGKAMNTASLQAHRDFVARAMCNSLTYQPVRALLHTSPGATAQLSGSC